jgi:GT2 family glycosyltransferase
MNQGLPPDTDLDKTIFIVLPVFNRYHFTKACLESLRHQTYKHFIAIVVDDGSTDGTPEQVQRDFPEAILLKTTGDLFWTGTVNLGIQWALDRGGKWIMTSNNDTLCPPDFMEGMARHMHQNPDALLGAVAIEQGTEIITYAGERLSWLTDMTEDLTVALKPQEQKGLHLVTHFPGRGLLVPAHIFRKIGLFDTETFPHYMADFDFTHRARRAGYAIYANFDARLVTYPDESGDHTLRKVKSLDNYRLHLFGIRGGGNLRNFFLFTFRHCPPVLWPWYIPLGLAKRTLGYFVK